MISCGWKGTEMPDNSKPKKERFAVIHVKVSPKWLTADGDCSEEEGWKEIEDRMNWLLASEKMVAKIELEMSFLEWDTTDREGL